MIPYEEIPQNIAEFLKTQHRIETTVEEVKTELAQIIYRYKIKAKKKNLGK